MGGQWSGHGAAAFYNLDLQGNVTSLKSWSVPKLLSLLTGYIYLILCILEKCIIKTFLCVFQFIGRTKNNKDYEIGNK